jgi:hypothetical protein
MLEKLNLKAKRNYLYLTLALAAFSALLLSWYFSKVSPPAISPPPIKEKLQPTERKREEIIKDLTAPEKVSESFEKELIQEISAPPKKPTPLPEEIIENLSAPKE